MSVVHMLTDLAKPLRVPKHSELGTALPLSLPCPTRASGMAPWSPSQAKGASECRSLAWALRTQSNLRVLAASLGLGSHEGSRRSSAHRLWPLPRRAASWYACGGGIFDDAPSICGHLANAAGLRSPSGIATGSSRHAPDPELPHCSSSCSASAAGPPCSLRTIAASSHRGED